MRQSRCARPPDRHAHPDRIGCGSSPWQMKQTPPAADAPWSAPPLPAAAAKLAGVGADVGEGVGVAPAAAAILAGVGADVGEGVGAGVRAGLGTRVGAVFGVAGRFRRGRSGVWGVDGASSTGQSSYGVSKTEQSPFGISESQSGAAAFGVAGRIRRGRSGVGGAACRIWRQQRRWGCRLPNLASVRTISPQINSRKLTP